MKKYKSLALLLTILCGLPSVLTGCKDEEDTVPAGNVDVTMSSTEPTEFTPTSIDRTSAQSVADGFINAIQSGDFQTVRSLINITDGTYLTPEDLEYVIRRSLIGYMIGQPGAFMNAPNLYEQSGKAIYSFYTTTGFDLSTCYSLNMELNEANEWSLCKQNFVKDSVLFYVPAGVRFYINDNEIGSNYKVSTENSVDIYRVPEVARRNFTTTIVSSIFGEISGEVSIPAYNEMDPLTYEEGEPIEVYREITPELFNELGERAKDIYNSVYQMMDSEASAENLNQYITSAKNYKFLEQYYNSGINIRRGISLDDNNVHQFTDTEILEFWQNPSVVSYVYSNDTIVINTILSLRWIRAGAVEAAKISAGVKLTKTPGGEWLLNDITPGAWTSLINGMDESNGVNAW